jgi:hypothetical protein
MICDKYRGKNMGPQCVKKKTIIYYKPCILPCLIWTFLLCGKRYIDIIEISKNSLNTTIIYLDVKGNTATCFGLRPSSGRILLDFQKEQVY